MRIVSGKYRGRAINPPKNLRARPTTDFAKENLFNVLGNLLDFEECDVLDLFAGTGSISYEFASRGARSVTAVEINAVHHDFIRRTAATAGDRKLLPCQGQRFPLPEKLRQAVRRDLLRRPLRPGGQRAGREAGPGTRAAPSGRHPDLRTFEKNGFFGSR